MQALEFVRILRHVVADGAAAGVIAQLERPSGRNPPEARKRLAAWFAALSPDDRRHVEAIVAESAGAALFGMLCVLDGVRAIEDGPGAGHLELRFVRSGESMLLASSADESTPMLHEFF